MTDQHDPQSSLIAATLQPLGRYYRDAAGRWFEAFSAGDSTGWVSIDESDLPTNTVLVPLAEPDPSAVHACGHEVVQRGCGGCDPGAIEWVRDDGGHWRKPTADETTATTGDTGSMPGLEHRAYLAEPELAGSQPATEPATPCPDCGAEVGRTHQRGCDVARCTEDGWQRLGGMNCHHDDDLGWDAIWTGRWPGEVECEELGLWCIWDGPSPERGWNYRGRGWVQCGPDEPDAQPDLNELMRLAAGGQLVWDRAAQRWKPTP